MADTKKTTSAAQSGAQSDQAAKADQPTRYFIVNPGGAVHEVTKDHARARIRVAGWRMATEAEIEQYHSQPEQRADKPIATPWADQLAELDSE